MKDHYYKPWEAPKGKRLSYFWDYYKIHTIVAILLIISVVSIVRATVFRTSSDSEILVATFGNKIHNDYVTHTEEMLSQLPIDFNNDGKSIVNIQKIALSEAERPEDAEVEYATQLKLTAVLSTAECIIQIVDEGMYEFLDGEGLIGTYDELSEYGYTGGEKIKVPLAGTVFSHELIAPYEDELYITLRPREASMLSGKKKEQNYNNQLKLIASLIR